MTLRDVLLAVFGPEDLRNIELELNSDSYNRLDFEIKVACDHSLNYEPVIAQRVIDDHQTIILEVKTFILK